ncbi:histidine kinase [soil metagenome]
MESNGQPVSMECHVASIDHDPRATPIRPLVLLAVWTVPALLSSFQRWASSALTDHPASFWRIAAEEWPGWYFWAAMTPLIFGVVAQFPLTRPVRARDIAAHAGAWTACSLMHALVMSRDFDAQVTGLSFGRYVVLTAIAWMPSTFLLYVVTMGAALWMRTLEREQLRDRERADLRVQLAHAELAALRSQLHPHFLFNTLNTIAILIRERETEASARLVTQLGDLLRRVLRGSRSNLTTLEDEIALVSSYLGIEGVRFGERLIVQWSLGGETLKAEVPSLVLQPLVENALRHGIARRTAGGTIEVGARRDGDDLVLWIDDNGPGTSSGVPVERTSDNGVGLVNTRERLARLYPGRSSLALHVMRDKGTRAEVRLPFRVVPVA